MQLPAAHQVPGRPGSAGRQGPPPQPQRPQPPVHEEQDRRAGEGAKEDRLRGRVPGQE